MSLAQFQTSTSCRLLLTTCLFCPALAPMVLQVPSSVFDIIYFVRFDWINVFIHDANKCTFDTHKYSLILLLHVSASFTSSSGSSTPRFKTYYNTVDYKSTSYYPWLQAYDAMLMTSALFWDITRRWVIILYRRFGPSVHAASFTGTPAARVAALLHSNW